VTLCHMPGLTKPDRSVRGGSVCLVGAAIVSLVGTTAWRDFNSTAHAPWPNSSQGCEAVWNFRR
jgi:hypothetical protein